MHRQATRRAVALALLLPTAPALLVHAGAPVTIEEFAVAYPNAPEPPAAG